jgi:hypothetical protein
MSGSGGMVSVSREDLALVLNESVTLPPPGRANAAARLRAVLDAPSGPPEYEQIAWRNDRGEMCWDHEHHHALDGIEWCEPVYRRVAPSEPEGPPSPTPKEL